MRRLLSILISLTLASIAAADEIVATVNGTRISYRQIACGPFLREQPAGCHRAEQAELDRLILDQWIDAATKSCGLVLGPNDVTAVEAAVEQSHATIVRSVGRFRALTGYVIQLRSGEDREKVYAEAARHGFKAWEVDQQDALFLSVSDAEAATRRDNIADAENDLRAAETRRILLGHIQDVIRSRAAANHEPNEEAAVKFWRDIAKKTETKILMSGFTLPDEKIWR